ncbi:hypothetical protein F4809DRAFT_591680 [Biscogniauxia mediterranea]|nr:hypothetical protein F4809DRAFT_591680 [Biscogniauxia mediterranea]
MKLDVTYFFCFKSKNKIGRYLFSPTVGSVPCMIPGYILRNEIRVLLHPSTVLGSLCVISAHPAGVGISNSVFCVLM